jgi:hypothetical protein
LDHKSFLGIVGALLGREDLSFEAGLSTLDGQLIAALGTIPKTSPVATPTSLVGVSPPSDRDPLNTTFTFQPGGGGLNSGLQLESFPDFGLYLFRSPRLWLAVRCGPIGQNGRGGHSHNDQLAIELSIDGADWLSDPGTYLYTPMPERRDAYRSVLAHAAPRFGRQEPGRLDLGLFWLGNEARAQCLYFGPDGFVGEHTGFGFALRRRIVIADDLVVIFDSGAPGPIGSSHDCRTADDAKAACVMTLPFSPGYGLSGTRTSPANVSFI